MAELEGTPPLDAWGAVGPLRPIGGGARGNLFRTGGRRPLVLRRSRHGEASMRWLQRLLGLAARAGLGSAAPLPSTDGRLVVGDWTAERWVEGRSGTRDDLRSLAPRIARMHALARGLPARPGAGGAAGSGRGRPPGDAASAPVRLRAALADARHGEVTAIHGDLHPGNLVVAPDGPVLIDWDEARRDGASFDLAALGRHVPPQAERLSAIWEIGCCWRPEPERARRLARALPGRRA